MTSQDTPSTTNIDGLVALAKTYFDAVYAMDADALATIFDPAASVTRRGDGDSVVVTPVAAWLDLVRSLTSPRDAGAVRADQILSIAITRDMALLKLRVRIPAREATDLLSCFYLGGRWRIVQKVFVAETLA
ncbi:nuclear transport factor 2 family protein [Bosea sp. (in: a-proteobacteria)]|uniref:nuclear transport factor 2 family protein n=1 Tax=Bosea sp. (in: a-proteobacteria) TaxID=1871050 RepID=UPI002DDC9FDE|nr:nuclear transport factor 2 family protein [Bosea sp. (in: a-proteobacteria)]HEV2509593.1 nuclear transport factor 2 family protein [Bosea sp. (in: a-proteobacteria)]